MIISLVSSQTWRSCRWSKEEASPLDEELSVVVGGVEDFFCFWEDGGDITTTESEFPKSKIIISNVST